MFNVDFRDIAIKNTPRILRRTNRLALFFVALYPLKSLNKRLNELRDKLRYKLLFNSQIIYLEHFLNDQFDSGSRGIYIVDTANVKHNFVFNQIEQTTESPLFNKAENKPLSMLNNSEFTSKAHFEIMVPSSLSFNRLLMEKQVDQYNQAATNYIIKTY